MERCSDKDCFVEEGVSCAAGEMKPEDCCKYNVCPECGRKKARSASDCGNGLCPKWYAVVDADALRDCERHSKGGA